MPCLGGMDRLKIATEALTLSRSILASIPCGTRIASIVQGFVKEALSKDDLYLSLGLDALIALDKAGIQGEIAGTGSSMEELGPYIKRNTLSKLKGPATALGGKIFNKASLAKSRQNMAQLENAVMSYQSRELRTKPLNGSFNIGQAITYMATGLNHKVRDEMKVNKRRLEILDDNGRDEADGDPSTDEVMDSAVVERKLKNTPLLMGPAGEPWGWIYIDGKSQDMTENQIIDAWNRASPGGNGTVTRSSFLNWLRNPKRQAVLRQIANSFLSKDLQKRLKLAVATGALDALPLHPFERELLALLA
jgi:hypothetical protein